ncbi:dolichyl-phosphate-mannose--protein mannosyltransferase [Echinicola pacifica]|uniref:Dolichyl-phosphate-mannose--protein mannosyltransferase n=1 Tax=Echinicola pacifica TaxID=346377 RepID=A0A918PV76_9BACT|nr:glycosyltransferase family 39 protein [Echinicola pacifica]GGZ21979.1 dolichyl-phosphate-mannose--protein mannosyltransferase [Echinicola pacifica]
MEKPANKWIVAERLLLVVALILHFSNLQGLSIYALDEAKNATAAIEMMHHHEWVIPTFNGEYRFDKPPLHYYFFILAYKIFGINEFAARFFPALFGFLTTYMVYRFVRKQAGVKAGLFTLLALSSSLHWYIQFHMAVPDPFLIFFMCAGMLSFYRWTLSGFRNTPLMLITYTSLALAVLSKGPVGVLIPFIALLSYGLISQMLNGKRLLRIFNPLGLAVFFAIALPWYVLVAIKTDGVWLQEFFFKHNLGRFSAPMEGHGGGFWLTWGYVIAGMLPFAVFLPQSVWYSIKFRAQRVTTFALVVAATIVLFFMFAGTKLPNYTVPAYPFLAILVGCYLGRLKKHQLRKAMFWPSLIYVILLIILPFTIYYGLKSDPSLTIKPALFIAFASPWMVLPLIYYSYKQRQLGRLAASMGGGFIVVTLVFFWYGFPMLDQQNPVLAAKLAEVKSGEVFYYKIFNPGFSFYLQRPIEDLMKVPDPPRADGFLITRKRFLSELDHLGLHYEIIHEGKDLFEPPITVVLKLMPASLDSDPDL